MSDSEDGQTQSERRELAAPLDPQQVERIGAVHRGFLYQHLYGVACLLTVGRAVGASVIFERDEDIELACREDHHYAQVKTRNRPLQPGDIADALERFGLLRKEHAEGRREGAARFLIITNAELGPSLAAAHTAKDWPADVSLVYPGSPNGPFPPAWVTIDVAFDWCVDKSKEIPFGTLSGETLVWKLAAQVLHAATGARERTFRAEELPNLLEQLLVQLQDFPDPPPQYRPQVNEPPLVTDARMRLVIGFSGAGKTAWASQAALHCPDPITYFDVSEVPAAAVATSLARELAARFAGGRREGIGGALFAEQSGLNVLRACDKRLSDDGLTVNVILDNVHRLDAATIRSLVVAAPGLRFLCLAQPWGDAAQVEAFHEIAAERLAGWSTDDIAAEFNFASTPISLETAARVLALTGGLPLYVRNAALLSARDYGHDAVAFCDAVERRVHAQATAQEIILEETVSKLKPNAARAAALLSLSDVPLTQPEAILLLGAGELSEADAADALRQLRRASVVIGFQGDRLGLHDAIRSLAVDARQQLADAHEREGLERLVLMLLQALQSDRDVARIGFLLRLLPQTGRTDVLVDLASDEMFHEQGDPRTLRTELASAAADTTKSSRDRFWANDALAYWESRDGGQPDLDRITTMESLVDEGGLGVEEQINLRFKEMIYWATEGDRARVDTAYTAAKRLNVEEPVRRMLRFNYAVALFRMRVFPEARSIADALILDYFKAIGISERDVLGKSNAALNACIPKPVDRSNFKRLADSLNLWSLIMVEMGEAPLLRRIAAMKFYGLVPAARSVVSTGQEAVDDFLSIMAQPGGALEVMEDHVLPVLRDNHLTDMIVPVRSHYAIVLAWNGRVEAARREMRTLQQYAGSEDQSAMLTERAAAIENIASGRLRLVRQPPPGAMAKILSRPVEAPRKMGRNERCWCGSGLKFKKCHGR